MKEDPIATSNREMLIRGLSAAILFLCAAAFPFLYLGTVFGLAGATSTYYVVFALGYLSLAFSSLVSFFKPWFYPAILLSIGVMITGIVLDTRFWKSHNEKLCRELRANPTCVESETGFNCENVNGFGMTVSSVICEDRADAVRQKAKEDASQINAEKDRAAEGKRNIEKALAAYSRIVDKIVASPTPEKESFQKELTAIYNCLEKELDPRMTGEQEAVRILTGKGLSSEQMAKYRAYLASKGINPSFSVVVAGLPAGDKSLSCEDID
jgi:hypothetical protein